MFIIGPAIVNAFADVILDDGTPRSMDRTGFFGMCVSGLYSTIIQSLPLRPKTSGEYISSALAGGTTKVPGVVARAT